MDVGLLTALCEAGALRWETLEIVALKLAFDVEAVLKPPEYKKKGSYLIYSNIKYHSILGGTKCLLMEDGGS